MGHEHAHAEGNGEGTFFLDQLFTILASGAIGLVAILMYQTGMLSRILVPMFFPWVLGGGVAILLMACIRAVAVWQMAGGRKGHGPAIVEDHGHATGHDHAHAHTEKCGHDHGHAHDHAHNHAAAEEDHGHDHGWAPWRYMVVAIPVFLYFLGLPREGFSNPERQLAKGSLSDPNRQALSLLGGGPVMTKALRKSQPEEKKLGFKELSEAAALPARHEYYDGDIGVIRGEFTPVPGTDREFTLVRWNMTCCRADAVVLETRIIAPDPVQISGNPWVKIKGVISFQRTERGKWIPVLTLQSNNDIEINVEPTQDANAY